MSFQDFISYDSVIPMAMWFDKKLDPIDVKIYAIIRNLSNKVGYCFATNEYISETTEFANRTIQRSLVTLKRNGYIEIETNKNGIYWQRRIYISDKFKKSLRSDSQVTPPRLPSHPPMTPESPITSINPNEEYLKETPPTPSKGDRVLYGQFVSLSKEEFEILAKRMGSVNALNELIEEMNDHLLSSGNKPYKDYAAAIRNWIRRRKGAGASKVDPGANKGPSDQFSEGANRSWWGKWRKLIHPYVRQGLMYDGSEYVSFSKEGVEPVKIYYRDPKFQEICENEFRKLGLFA